MTTYKQTREQFLLALNSNAYMNICTSDDMFNVIVALDKQIPNAVVKDGDDNMDYIYCPRCDECIGSNEMVWEDFYHNSWHPMYCQCCGQTIIWEEQNEKTN